MGGKMGEKMGGKMGEGKMRRREGDGSSLLICRYGCECTAVTDSDSWLGEETPFGPLVKS
jgi:hypothetical protein